MSVGQLSIKLQADAQQFDRVINGAEHRLTAFAAKASKAMKPMGNLIGAGMQSLMRGGTAGDVFSDIANGIPGPIGVATKAVGFLMKTAEDAMGRLDKLGEDASRIGVDAQFLRGLQIAAEEEAAAIEPVMTRLLKFQGQLKAGSTDLMEAGGSSAGKLAKELNLNMQEWIHANPEELFGKFAKRVQEASLTGEEFAVATQLAGKSAAGLMNTLRDAEGVDKYTKAVRDAGVATKLSMAITQEWDDLQKSLLITRESLQEKSILSGGLMSSGVSRLMTGEGGGIHDFLTGLTNLPRQLAGAEAWLTAGMTTTIFDNASKAVEDAAAKLWAIEGGEKWKPLSEMMDLRNELAAEIEAFNSGGEGLLGAGAAERLLGITSRLKGLIPKSPRGSADDVQDKLLEAVMEPDNLAIRSAQELMEQMRTPSEIADAERSRLRELYSTGMLGDETYQRALQKLSKGLDQPLRESAREAGVAEVGSQEWAKSFLRSTEGMEEKDDEQLEELKKANELKRELREEMRKFNETKPKALQVPPG